MKLFRDIFSTPAASFFALLIAILSINAWQLVLPNFSYDNSFAIAAAKNIFDSKGYSLAKVSAQDLSATYYEPLNKWPPGYSWLLVTVKKLTGTDWAIACYILNAAGATLLMIVMRKILLLLKTPVWIANAYIIFAGFVPYPFLGVCFADLMATAFFMWAMVFLIKMIISNRQLFLNSIVAGLLLSYCAWLKYLYYSISFVPFVFLLFYSLRINNSKLVKALAPGSVVLLAGIIYILWFQQWHSGSAVYINSTGKGFFPEHILAIGPIVPCAFIDFKFFDLQLSRILEIPYLRMVVLWQWLNIFLMIGLLLLAIKYYKQKGFHLSNPLSVYVHLVFAVSFSILVLLVYLSLTQKPYRDNSTAFWTYVQELRYYAVSLIFIQQGILFLIVYKKKLLSKSANFFTAVIILFAFIEIAHGFYYLSKQIFIKHDFGLKRKTEQIDFLALKIADSLQKKNERLVICSDNHELANIASLSGIAVLYDWASLNKMMSTSKPVTLLVILSSSSLPYYSRFFSIYHPKLFLQFDMPNSAGKTADFYIVKFS